MVFFSILAAFVFLNDVDSEYVGAVLAHMAIWVSTTTTDNAGNLEATKILCTKHAHH